MGEAQPFEEFQRAIDGGRLGRLAMGAEGGDEVVGLLGGVGLEQQFEDAAAGAGEAFLRRDATALGRREGVQQRLALEARMRAVGVVTLGSHVHWLPGSAPVGK